MVTGDNIDTAVAIAKQCGILRPGIDVDIDSGDLATPQVAMTGAEFRRQAVDPATGRIRKDAFDNMWPYLRVLARSSPTDKYVLVSGIMNSDLYRQGTAVRDLGIFPDRQVVAVTGDGTNDAPALKKADVGFAMGMTGTSVAKDASDIVITNDDFAAIVEACKWGRNVYDSISKFLQFQLTVNIVAVTLACLGAVTTGGSPLSATQMLWVNLIMDSLGALALASEAPTEDLLERPPYGRNAGLFSPEMKFHMAGESAYQLAILIAMLYGAGPTGKGEVCDMRAPYEPPMDCTACGGWLDIPSGIDRALKSDAPTQHYTLIFNTFVMMQLFNWINCRKIYNEWNVFRGLERNPIFVSIWLVCFGTQVLIIEVAGIGRTGNALLCESINRAFKTVGLRSWQWALSLGLGAGSLVWRLVLLVLMKLFLPKSAAPQSGTRPDSLLSGDEARMAAGDRPYRTRKEGTSGSAAPKDRVPTNVGDGEADVEAITLSVCPEVLGEGASPASPGGTNSLTRVPSMTRLYRSNSLASGIRQAERVAASREAYLQGSSLQSDLNRNKTVELFKRSNS
ncbi:unnamed protein product [Amoebophrya sp. A25]|nr:unnamed protein product [Amoebophrya sp. A25]|eukprot:GSA25T00013523001.1